MAYLKITRYGCRPLGYGPLVIGGEPVLAWQHIATGRRVFTCPDMLGFGWKIEGDPRGSEAFSSSLRAAARKLERDEAPRSVKRAIVSRYIVRNGTTTIECAEMDEAVGNVLNIEARNRMIVRSAS